MMILFASDHAGFELKGKLLEYVKGLGYDVEDMGAYELDSEDDYPDYISLVAKEVSEKPDEIKGIILGGSGQGEAIVANRFPNVRAMVFNGKHKPENNKEVPHEIIISREHNDTNILSLGARFLDLQEAKEAVSLWLLTPFSKDERHIRRIKKIEKYSYHGN